MIAEVATRVLTKRLRKAGWKPIRADGSHHWWECATRMPGVSVPDGHNTISPGVHRSVNKAMTGCDCK